MTPAAMAYAPDSLTGKALRVSLSRINRHTEGRVDIMVANITFETYIRLSATKRLFVFFSAGGRTTQETTFHRISWSSVLAGICLYIEDPMLKQYAQLPSGWFYGTAKHSYLQDAIAIVKKLASLHAVAEQNICIIGSSSGGYCAIYAGNHISGSTVIASNPQITPASWPRVKSFTAITGYRFDQGDPCQRDNVASTLCPNTTYLLWFNTRSEWDLAQLKPLLERLGLPLKEGTHCHGAITVMLYRIVSLESPHAVYIGLEDTIALTQMAASQGMELNAASIAHYADAMAERYRDIESERFVAFWRGLLSSKPSNRLIDCPQWCNKPYIMLKVKNLSPQWRYELYKFSNQPAVKPAFHIVDATLARNPVFIDDIKAICHYLQLDLKCQPNRVILSLKPLDENNLASGLNDFINRTWMLLSKLYQKWRPHINDHTTTNSLRSIG